jgi:hypothetical protein
VKISKTFIVRHFDHLATGDLFEMDVNGMTVLAIKLSQPDDADQTDMAVLRSSSEELTCPYIMQHDSNNHAKSFGGDWLLELGEVGATFDSSSGSSEHVGAIAVGADKNFLVLGDGRPSSRDVRSVELSDLRVSRITGKAVLHVREWSIWLDAADRDRPNAKPFFHHPA